MKELPKAYEPQQYEDAMYKRWEDSGFFAPEAHTSAADNLDTREPYAIMMPPPNVTGVLHLGHALENSLMDLMTRYQRMQGKKVLLLPGTDHAAVATQARVEKNLVEAGMKNPREELGREGLLEKVREYSEQSKATILKQIRKMGTSADWSRLAYTFDDDRNLAVKTAFKKMYDDGLIYRGYRVVNWSVKGQSTCSDDELVYIDRKAKLYTFKYAKDFPITIATTRPETKLGDTAVAVNPDDVRYKEFIGKTFDVDFCGNKLKLKVIADVHVDPAFGTGALGVTPAHSGIDFEMYEKKKAEGDEIDLIQVIGADGKMTTQAGEEFVGLTVEEAREKVVKKLDEAGLIQKEESAQGGYALGVEIDQNVGTSDRFGDVVESIPMTQWFVDVNKEIPGRGKSLKTLMRESVSTGLGGDANKKVTITPDRFEKIYYNWIDNLRDWCISRQIWWGHRIPSYYNISDPRNYEAMIIYQGGIIGSEEIQKQLNKIGVEFSQSGEMLQNPKEFVWWSNPYTHKYGLSFRLAYELVKRNIVSYDDLKYYSLIDPQNIAKVECFIESPIDGCYFQEVDTLDTWFSAGLWTFSTLGWPNNTDDFKTFYPTSWMQMGHEILFFWMARMILFSGYLLDDIPFKDVYIHGILRDKDGKKFSKSMGNGIDPLDVISEYGTDALRWSLLSGITPGNDSRFYLEKVESAQYLVNKIWNMSRFMLMNIDEPKKNIDKPKSNTLFDEWILNSLNSTVSFCSNAIQSYQFSLAGESLRDFTLNELADWYLEVSKIEGNKSEILNYILNILLKLWHPFMPFVTEAIWQEIYGKESCVMIEKWPILENDNRIDFIDDKLIKFDSYSVDILNLVDNIRHIITSIRSIRGDYKIDPVKKLSVAISAGESTDIVQKNVDIIKALARLDTLVVQENMEKPAQAVSFVESGVEVFINLEGVIDFDKERTRLTAEIQNIQSYVQSLEKKLSNAGFVDNAPAEVVAQEKEKFEQAQENLKKLQTQFDALQ